MIAMAWFKLSVVFCILLCTTTALPVGAKAIGRIPAIGRTPVGATAHPDMMGGIGATAQLEQAPAQLEKAKHGSPAQLENQMKDPGGAEDVC